LLGGVDCELRKPHHLDSTADISERRPVVRVEPPPRLDRMKIEKATRVDFAQRPNPMRLRHSRCRYNRIERQNLHRQLPHAAYSKTALIDDGKKLQVTFRVVGGGGKRGLKHEAPDWLFGGKCDRDYRAERFAP
jgi:hypothetical protein